MLGYWIPEIFSKPYPSASFINVVLVIPNVDVIVGSRSAIESSSAEGEVTSAGLITRFSARWCCSRSGFNFRSLRALLIREGGRSERNGLANSMNS